MPIAKHGIECIANSDHIYVIGGMREDDLIEKEFIATAREIHVWDPRTGSWSLNSSATKIKVTKVAFACHSTGKMLPSLLEPHCPSHQLRRHLPADGAWHREDVRDGRPRQHHHAALPQVHGQHRGVLSVEREVALARVRSGSSEGGHGGRHDADQLGSRVRLHRRKWGTRRREVGSGARADRSTVACLIMIGI